MIFGILTTSSPEYLSLARITVPNRLVYSLRHGYDFFYRLTPEAKKGRIQAMLDCLPQVDWLWYQGADVMLTNMTKMIEEVLVENVDFMIGEDRMGINNDSMLLRNCEAVNVLLQHLLDWEKSWNDDQACLAHLLGGFDWRVPNVAPRITGLRAAVVPQRVFNSYPDYDFYGDPQYPGRWQKGDFVAHFPAMTIERKIERCRSILSEVVV